MREYTFDIVAIAFIVVVLAMLIYHGKYKTDEMNAFMTPKTKEKGSEKKGNPLVLLYLVWIFLNFICLMVSDKLGDFIFYPFQSTSMATVKNGRTETVDMLTHAYDFSEFAVYTIAPLFLIFIYNSLNKTN